MTHYKDFFDPSPYVAAHELGGKDVTVTIVRATGGTVEGEKGRKARKGILYFKGAKKPLVLNKTNGKTIAAMYGNHVEEWVGKRITLFPTTTTRDGETVECIRVRPRIPVKGAPEGEFVLDEQKSDAQETSGAAEESLA